MVHDNSLPQYYSCKNSQWPILREFFWLGLVFLKVIVQYKIHTTVFNFGNLQKNFMPFNYGSGQDVAYITLFVLHKHVS